MGAITSAGLTASRGRDFQEINFRAGLGGLVTDVAGTSYVDFIMGYGAVVLGHADPIFVRAVSDQASAGTLLPGYGDVHRELVDLIFGEERALTAAFFKTGSESVTAAIRLACARTDRRGVLRCGFIGWHDVEVANSPRWHEPPTSRTRHQLRYETGFRGVSGPELVRNWATLELSELQLILEREGDGLGCLIVDTYQTAFMDPETLNEGLQLCRQHGLAVIADETKTAGRVNRAGIAAERGWDVDYTVLGKAIGNGAPLSLLAGSAEAMQPAEELRITGTFSGELLAVAAATATVRAMNEGDGFERLRAVTLRVVETLSRAASRSKAGELVHVLPMFDGAMFEIGFGRDLTENWPVRAQLCTYLADSGVLMLQGHASYCCLGHAELNHANLEEWAGQGLSDWAEEVILP